MQEFMIKNWDLMTHNKIREILMLHTSIFYRYAHKLGLQCKNVNRDGKKDIFMKYLFQLKWNNKPFNIKNVSRKEGFVCGSWFLVFCRKNPEYFYLNINRRNTIIFNNKTRKEACELLDLIRLKNHN
jgi:hypothetical protein